MKDIGELTTHCIRCGFCLETCPTFVETGSELESPRGRIYLVRSALEGKLRWREDVAPHLDLCLGCRNCETACPSAVEYGAILEMARDRIEKGRPQWGKSLLLKTTTTPAMLKLTGLLPVRRMPSLMSRPFSSQKPEADLPTPQRGVELPPLTDGPAVVGEVFLLEGCAMSVLFPRVHQATRRLLRRVGYTVRETTQGCCGALHIHNGHIEEAHRLARDLARAFASQPSPLGTGGEGLPIVVNSAGCGSTMKEYEDRAFAARVKDASEFLLNAGLKDALASSRGLDVTVTYHDACHLAHGQKITSAPRELLKAIPGVNFVEMNEADLCCGSAGIYNVLQPKMARRLVERKYANIAATGASIVVTGNPGCHAWIAQAAREHGQQVKVMHTIEFLEAAFTGLEEFAD